MLTGSLFITGTDTDVGKTYIACALLRAIAQRGIACAGFKPIACGDRSDATLLQSASSKSFPIDLINPLWFQAPVAPIVAAREEQKAVELAPIFAAFEQISTQVKLTVVEGAGGWLVPISSGLTMADLATRFAAPILLVAANKLGALNHVLLTVESIRSRKLNLAGVILNNHPATPISLAFQTNAAVLGEILEVPIIPIAESADLTNEALDSILNLATANS